MNTTNRPLSPHLQIYKPQLTSVLSISHRMTGFALSMIILLSPIIIYFLTYSVETHQIIISILRNTFIKIILITYTSMIRLQHLQYYLYLYELHRNSNFLDHEDCYLRNFYMPLKTLTIFYYYLYL